MMSETIPIYWGNPHIDKEFNPNSFIWIRDKRDVDDAIEKVIMLDQNDEKWIEMMNNPWTCNNYIETELSAKVFDEFIFNIFKQESTKAMRRSKFIYGANHENRVKEGYILSQGKMSSRGYKNFIMREIDMFLSNDLKFYNFNGCLVPKQNIRIDSFFDIFYPHIMGIEYSVMEADKYYNRIKEWIPIIRYLGDRFIKEPDKIIDWNKCKVGDILALHGSFYFNSDVTINKEDIVFDVGASPGDFTSMALAKGAKDIHSFESTQNGIEKLCRLREITRSFHCVHKLVTSTNDPSKEMITLDAYSDNENINKVNFIKINVDGAEKDVILGAVNILINHQPKIAVCSYHRVDDAKTISALIQSINPKYKIIQGKSVLYCSI